MKNPTTLTLTRGVCALCLLALTTQLSAQTSAFTYQGVLSQNGQPANGTYDFMFRLLDAETDGTAAPVIPLNPGVGVTNGLFTTGINFDAENLNGANLWLEISVRTNGGGAFTTLAPRQLLTSAPYAVKALEAATAAEASSVPQGTITSVMLADGAVTSAKIAPGAVSQLGAPDGSNPEAVVVNANGSIGIGTNQPAAGLHLASSISTITGKAHFQVRDEQDGYTNLLGTGFLAYNGMTLAVSAYTDSAVTLVQFSPFQVPTRTAQLKDGIGGFDHLDGANSVALDGNLLAVVGYNVHAVSLIDVSDPYSPILLSVIEDNVDGFDLLRYPLALALKGNLLVVSSSENAVSLIDVSTPTSPALLATLQDDVSGFDRLGSPAAVSLNGDLLAIASFDEGAVTLVDIGEPVSPTLQAVLYSEADSLTAPKDVLLTDDLMFIAGGLTSKLAVYDVRNSVTPVLLTEIPLSVGGTSAGDFSVRRLAVDGGTLVAAAAAPSPTVLIVDIEDPASSRVVGAVKNGMAGIAGMNFPNDLIVANGSVAVANSDGFNILRLVEGQVSMATDYRVGIGTSLPQASLHVLGDFAVEAAEHVAINTHSFAVGHNAHAPGQFATAIGHNSSATGNYSLALGSETIASGHASTALGYQTKAQGDYSLASGIQTTASGYASLAAGNGSTATGTGSTAMGYGSVASGGYSTAMGYSSIADGPVAFAVGWEAKAHGPYSTAIGWGAESTNIHSIAMGYYAQSHGESSVAFGFGTRASGTASTALGASTQATNSYTLAAGRRAMAWHAGSLVWGDSTDSDIASTNNNSVTFRASGGYRLFSNAATNAGVALAPNATAWSVISDREVKKDFAAVDGREVLEKLAAVPVQSWHYQWESADATPHLGPVAQDFKAAFYPGRDDTSITTLEFDGVALAAIQGLNQKLEAELHRRDTENAELKRQNRELLKRLEAIEARLR
jgi:hypothetical protein